MKNIDIQSGSVRVMRSYDYSHFEVCLTSTEANTVEAVDELRKTAARLVDKAVEQFKTAKVAAAKMSDLGEEWLLNQARHTPENERTPEEKAIIKYHEDKDFRSQFNYDYDDEWEMPAYK